MSTDRSEDSLVSAPAKSTASGSCGNTGAATGNKGKSQKKKGKSFLPALLGNKKNPPHSSRGSASARNSTRKQQKANSSSLSDRKPAARETQNAGQDTPRSTLSNTSVEPFSSSPSGDILSKIVAQSAHEARASLVGDSDPNCSEVCAHVTHIEELYTKQEDKGAKGSMKAAKGLNSSTDDMILGRLVEERMEQEECTQYKIHHSAKATIAKAKSDVGSIALSQAKPEDKEVYNDIVKLFVVGDNSANRSKLGAKLVYETLKIDGELPKDTGRKSRPTLRVDVNTWKPENTELNFTMWDVQSSKSKAGEEHLPNFGAHPDVQSLFFSDQALYLLVYDMAENDAENDASAYEAAQALEADIRKRVLSWIDCIARRTNRSVILPVAVVPSSMSSDEATSRCKITKDLLLRYTEELPEGIRPDILFCENDTLARVSLCEPEGNNSGLDDLAQLVVRKGVSAIPLVGRSVPPGTVEIWNELKARTATVMKVDDFIGELSRERKDSKEAVTEVLSFLASIGEVLYFNCSESDVKNYVINLTDSNSDENDTSHNKSAKLSMNKDDKLRVFVRGLCVFLQKRFESNLSKARSFVRGQYACQEMQFPYPESFISQTFTQEASSTCPLLSSSDMALLWHASLFDEEVEIFFPFLKVLLAHFGIFLPLGINETDETYFIPCLLPQPSTGDFWTYNCETPNKTTICNSWVFEDGMPSGLMGNVAVALLRDLYKSAYPEVRRVLPLRSNPRLHRANTYPFSNFNEIDDEQATGPIHILRTTFWKDSFLIVIGQEFSTKNGFLETTEILVALTDKTSTHTVASDSMEPHWQRLIVSAKGKSSDNGRKIWRGGYKIVLDSVEATIKATKTKNCSKIERQVACPVCLQRSGAPSAISWSLKSINRESALPHILCTKGHQTDYHLIRGTVPAAAQIEYGTGMPSSYENPVKKIEDLLPSVVIVALWDDDSKREMTVGTGFVANKELGLVVTASHTFFDMSNGGDENFGAKYRGLKNAKVKVGVIASDGAANWRYYAEIVAHDVSSIDTCVLKITTTIGGHSVPMLQNELKITNECDREQTVRLIGFNQTGEGMYERGMHVNRRACYKKGTISKISKARDIDDYTESDLKNKYLPQEEIQVDFGTYENHGYSGGPCVNDEGEVVGILSREFDKHSYLIPSKGIRILLEMAEREVRGKNRLLKGLLHGKYDQQIFETQYPNYEERGIAF